MKIESTSPNTEDELNDILKSWGNFGLLVPEWMVILVVFSWLGIKHIFRKKSTDENNPPREEK